MDRFRNYISGDVYSIYPELEEVKKGSFSVVAFDEMALHHSGYTIEDEQDILFTTFASLLWPGCGSVCALMSGKVDTREKTLRVTKGSIAITEQWGREGMRRIHTLINPASEEDVRWCAMLGFQYESTMFKALPDGGDIHTYVKWLVNGG